MGGKVHYVWFILTPTYWSLDIQRMCIPKWTWSGYQAKTRKHDIPGRPTSETPFNVNNLDNFWIMTICFAGAMTSQRMQDGKRTPLCNIVISRSQ